MVLATLVIFPETAHFCTHLCNNNTTEKGSLKKRTYKAHEELNLFILFHLAFVLLKQSVLYILFSYLLLFYTHY